MQYNRKTVPCLQYNRSDCTRHADQEDLPSVEAAAAVREDETRATNSTKYHCRVLGDDATDLTPRINKNMDTRPSLTPKMTSRRYLQRGCRVKKEN